MADNIPTTGELVEQAFDSLAEATERLIEVRNAAAEASREHENARLALLSLRDITESGDTADASDDGRLVAGPALEERPATMLTDSAMSVDLVPSTVVIDTLQRVREQIRVVDDQAAGLRDGLQELDTYVARSREILARQLEAGEQP